MSNVRGTVGMSVQLESVSRQTRYFQRQISASNTDWTTFSTDAWVPTMSGDFLLTVIWRRPLPSPRRWHLRLLQVLREWGFPGWKCRFGIFCVSHERGRMELDPAFAAFGDLVVLLLVPHDK